MCAHKNMKKYWLLLLATMPFWVGSCMSDNKGVQDDYCYISDVTLGTMKFEVQTQDSLGNDTTEIRTYTGSNFSMTIDQRTLTIENRDSLLYGTLLRSVLINVSYVGSGLLYRVKDDADSIWRNYSNTDSVDLRKPLELLLLANNSKSYRIYTLKLNVHKQEGDSLYWKKDGEDVPQLQGLLQQSAVTLQGSPAVLGKDDNAIVFAKRTQEGTWEKTQTNLPAEADVQTVVKKGNEFFVSTTDGYIYSSVDGESWGKANMQQHPGLMLAGATSDYLYVLMDGELYSCVESEQGEWTFLPESLDESSVNLPSRDVKSLLMRQKNGSPRFVMVGNRANENDKTSVVWNKMWDEDISEGEAVWMFVNQTYENKCPLPQLEYLNLIGYDEKCMAFGGASVPGKGTNKAMDALYVSLDYGISWRTDSGWHLPTELKGFAGPICSVVDDDNVIWIIANAEVWRGKLNRLDFKRQ